LRAQVIRARCLCSAAVSGVRRPPSIFTRNWPTDTDIVNIRGNSYRMRQRAELYSVLHRRGQPAEPDLRAAGCAGRIRGPIRAMQSGFGSTNAPGHILTHSRPSRTVAAKRRALGGPRRCSLQGATRSSLAARPGHELWGVATTDLTTPPSPDKGADRAREDEDASAESLVTALRMLISKELKALSQPRLPKFPTRLQGLFVLLFVVNIVLLVSLFPGLDIESPTWKLLATVIPPVLGGYAIVSLHEVRERLFRWADRWRFRTIMVAVSIALLSYLALSPWAGFVYVRTDPNALVSAPSAWEVVKQRDGLLWKVTGLSFGNHKIIATSGEGDATDTIQIGRSELARTFVRSVPLVGQLLGIGPIPVEPRRDVKVDHGAVRGWLEVHGNFSKWFLRSANAPYKNQVFVKGGEGTASFVQFQMRLTTPTSTEDIYIPPGSYLFVFVSGVCRDTLRGSVPPLSRLDFKKFTCPPGK
jgi:hypothetical protein